MIKVRLTICLSLAVSFLCVVTSQGFAQETVPKPLISVSVQIVGMGTVPTYNHNTTTGYFTEATVTNLQDTTIVFWIMSCGWPYENWLASNDSVNCGSFGCDNNIPDDIHLPPHHSIHFYTLLWPSANKPLCKKVKLGFRYYAKFADIMNCSNQRIKAMPPRLYWSNEVEIKDNLFQYQTD